MKFDFGKKTGKKPETEEAGFSKISSFFSQIHSFFSFKPK